RQRFLDALRKTTGTFLQVAEDTNRAIESFDEPIGKIARYYRLDDLDAAAAAAELGIESGDRLVAFIRSDPRLGEYGLGPLAQGGHIKRGDWEKLEGNSVMQRASRELGLGTPLREIVAGYSCQPKSP